MATGSTSPSTAAGRWKNVGLKNSEHIARIEIDPRNSDVVYVAAQGPLWSKGGDRGLYKTTDGGATWNRLLSVDDWTGVNDVTLDPRDPDTLVATTWQRVRRTHGYVGGGPGSGVHRSTDGGKTWTKSQSGFPAVDLGRIGLARSPPIPASSTRSRKRRRTRADSSGRVTAARAGRR